MSAYFPPGTDIGGFVIEVFLKQNYLGHSYLAVDSEGEKYLVSVLNSPADLALQNDLDAWANTHHPAILSDISFYSKPVQMIVTPYCKGLTFEEEALAGNTLTPAEAVHILREITAARADLISSGAADNFISPESIFLTPDRQLVIQRDNLYYGNFDNTYKQLVNACFALVDPPPGISVEELKQQFLSDPEKKLIIKKVSPSFSQTLLKHQNKITAFCVLLAVLLISGVLLSKWKKPENTAPSVQTLTATHHSQGPVVHEAKQQQKTPPVPIPTPPDPIPAKKDMPLREVPRRVPVLKVVRKVVPKNKQASPPVKKINSSVAEAAKRGNLFDLKFHINNKADVNAPDANGKTAMFYAASANWKAMIHLLHNAGAKITQQDINAASKKTTRRYMRSLLAPPRNIPRAVNAVPNPRPAVRRMVIPRTHGWKKGEKKWNITVEHAILKARPFRKKIFVLFTGADWCGPCKMLASQVLSSSDFRRLSRQMELVYINFPRNEKMPLTQKSYNAKLRRELAAGGGVPTAIILDHNGKQIGKIGGYRPKDRYISELRNLLRK